MAFITGAGCIHIKVLNTTWATRIAEDINNGNTLANSITVDSSDNIIVSGSYGTNSVNLYDAPGVSYTLQPLSNSGANDVYIVKYSSNGVGKWATRIAGTDNELSAAHGITVDSSDNIIVSGLYSSNPVTIYNVGGSPFGTLSLYSTVPLAKNAFIVKYDSAGSAMWATRIAGNDSNEYGANLTVDSSNNIIASGVYGSNPVYIYNANGSQFVTSLPNSGSTDVYIVKYDSTGFAMWATRIAGSGDDYGYDITVDSNNDIIVIGWYMSSSITIYDAAPNVSTRTLDNSDSSGNTSDAYIVKYGSDGISKWATRIAGTGNEYGYGITVDSNNDIIVTGSYTSSPVTIYNAPGTSGTLTLDNSGATDAYIVKYGSDGISKWATRIAGTGNEYGYGVAVDSNNNIIVIGFYTLYPITIYDAAPSVSTRTLDNSGGYDVFIVKYNSSGISQWATRIAETESGTGFAYGLDITVDSSDNIIVTGYYRSNIITDTNPITIYNANGSISGSLNNSGNFNAFVVKYNTNGFVDQFI